MRFDKAILGVAIGAALGVSGTALADAGDTTVGGTAFIDITDINTKQNANPVPAGTTTGSIDPNGYGLDVTRFYLIVNHTFDETWSTNLTTDFNFASYKATSTSTVTGGVPGETVSTKTTVTTPSTQLFIKKAYIQGKFSDLAVLRLGSEDTPWIPYVEGIYGYRFLEKTITDKNGFGNSADWGASLSGDNGTLSYNVMALNGNGFKNPSRSKTMDFEGRVGFVPFDGLTIAGDFYTGELGQDTEANEQAASAGTPPSQKNTATRQDLLVDWKGSGLNVGLEYFHANDFLPSLIFTNGVTAKEDSQSGYSLFGSYTFPGTKYAVFARYDDLKPTKDTVSTQEQKYYNAGFSWVSVDGITWAVAYKSTTVDNNLKQATDNNNLKTSEVGLWAQVKF